MVLLFKILVILINLIVQKHNLFFERFLFIYMRKRDRERALKQEEEQREKDKKMLW